MSSFSTSTHGSWHGGYIFTVSGRECVYIYSSREIDIDFIERTTKKEEEKSGKKKNNIRMKFNLTRYMRRRSERRKRTTTTTHRNMTIYI